ncbi:MAG: hypothetical protein J7M38_01730 [Armatimonadetes bacterium]|nr:hypothetical protein [Armatimonadota bacterium]
MSAAGVLYHPITVFAISLLCAWLLYLIGRAIAPASQAAAGKLRTYACGENVDGKSFPTAYHLFHAAFIFTLLDVLALVAGTVSMHAALWLAISYLAVGFVCIIILFQD